jgi:hypothetical protein
MNWLDRLLGEERVKTCPPCPLSPRTNGDESLKGGKGLVPDLSPYCPPLNSDESQVYGGHLQPSPCPQKVSPFKPAQALDLACAGTKGTQGTDTNDSASVWDSRLEALCAGLAPGDALALREERAGILEHLAGLDRAEAEHRAGLDARPP